MVLLHIRQNKPQENSKSKGLTIRKQAPKIMAFIFTSRFKGKQISKCSESAAAATRPFHFLVILPIDVPSRDFTLKDKNLTL